MASNSAVSWVSLEPGDSASSLIPIYLRNSEERLGNVNNIGELRNRRNALLNGRGVVDTSRVQDILDLVDLTSGPLSVRGSTIGSNGVEDRAQREEDNGLLVDDVQLVGDGRNGEGGDGRDDGGLGDQ